METALQMGNGALTTATLDEEEDLLFSESLSCKACDISFPKLTPQSFHLIAPKECARNAMGLELKLTSTKT